MCAFPHADAIQHPASVFFLWSYPSRNRQLIRKGQRLWRSRKCESRRSRRLWRKTLGKREKRRYEGLLQEISSAEKGHFTSE